MKNKGFTLIELIVTITLLAIISITIGVSVSNMLANQKEKEAENMKETIEKAACVYVDTVNESLTEVSLKTLIDEGLIDKDLVNPITKESLDINSKVNINIVDNEKNCTYDFPGLN